MLRAHNLIRSRDFTMMYGSDVLRVVRTVILPSTKFNSQSMPCLERLRVTRGHTSRRYFSRYLGKRVAKELSSRRRPPGNASEEAAVSSHGCTSQ